MYNAPLSRPAKQMSNRQLKATYLAVPFAVMTLGMAVRADLVDSLVAEILQCGNCAVRHVIINDLLVLSAVAAALWLSSVLPTRFLRIVFTAFSLLLVLAYVLDIGVMLALGTRLFFSDVSIYAVEWGAIWDHLRGFTGGTVTASLVLVLTAGLIFLMMLAGNQPGRLGRYLLPGVAALSFAIYVFSHTPEYIHSWRFKNYFFANFTTAETHRYSEQYRQTLLADALPSPECLEGQDRRPNIILLLVESWSQYHSELFSGLNDWTPELDEIARENTRFSQFFANGFTTNTGLVSSLTPIQLDAPFENVFLRSDSFAGTWHFDKTLPRLVAHHDYHSAFLTTGPLGFTNKGDWLKSLGFDYVEGNNATFYRAWPKVQFQAATDEALYLRARQWIGEQEGPFALVLENVSSHQPYIDPVSRERSLEKTIRYVDRQITIFYRGLLEDGFFDNGIMVIASDHRAMNLVTREELDSFGLQAVSRVPMILIDPRTRLPAVDHRIVQQSDLFFSLRHLLERGAVCPDLNEVSFYDASEDPGKCALHLRGTRKGIVDVTCKSGEGQVVMDGDDTRFEWSEGLTTGQQQRLLSLIARQRLALLEDETEKPAGD